MLNSQHMISFEDGIASLRENAIIVYESYDLMADDKIERLGIVIKIISEGTEDEDAGAVAEESTLLVRPVSGIDEVIPETDLVAIVRPEAMDEVVRLYMLSKFLHFKAQDIPAQIEMRVVAEAGSSARELAIEFQARVDYRDYFRSASLSTSVDRVISRYFEDKAHGVKALPAY